MRVKALERGVDLGQLDRNARRVRSRDLFVDRVRSEVRRVGGHPGGAAALVLLGTFGEIGGVTVDQLERERTLLLQPGFEVRALCFREWHDILGGVVVGASRHNSGHPWGGLRTANSRWSQNRT